MLNERETFESAFPGMSYFGIASHQYGPEFSASGNNIHLRLLAQALAQVRPSGEGRDIKYGIFFDVEGGISPMPKKSRFRATFLKKKLLSVDVRILFSDYNCSATEFGEYVKTTVVEAIDYLFAYCRRKKVEIDADELLHVIHSALEVFDSKLADHLKQIER
ncbi:MAG: hypothetical protein JSS71_06945 [Armatimonadetes bacterium]|nr:hypothetical protein [Armatimonadota bacterium]MBX3107632.1 hypothetical protein [Fimbriimonadaceae bacterium]